jgi:hypothetical protein
LSKEARTKGDFTMNSQYRESGGGVGWIILLVLLYIIFNPMRGLPLLFRSETDLQVLHRSETAYLPMMNRKSSAYRWYNSRCGTPLYCVQWNNARYYCLILLTSPAQAKMETS